MPITVRVTPAGCDVRRVQDVGIDELDLGVDPLIEVLVSFFDVLAPEVGSFEEFGAVGDFAAVFGRVFLFDELRTRTKSVSQSCT